MRKPLIAYIVSVAVLAAAVWLGVSIGAVHIPISTLWNRGADQTSTTILWNIRMPRVILAGLVGASLAIAGAAFQGLLKNPLADPYTLGVSSGASVGAVMTLFFGISLPFLGLYTLPVFSMIGAAVTMFIVLGFAKLVDRGLNMETIILTGIIFGSFLGSVLSLMIALSGEELRQVIGWLLGSVSMRGWNYVWMIVPFTAVGSFLLWVNRRELNAMLFGEERAKHLGVNVARRKLVILIGGSILTGAAVSVSGTIGFIGLVVPHMTRLLFGSDHRHLLTLSFLNGASLLIFCDLLARTIIAPTELPVGVITAFIGAPVFALIFYRQRKGGAA